MQNELSQVVAAGTPHQSIDWLPWESGRPEVHSGGPCRSRPSCSGCSCIYRLLCLFSCMFFPFLWLNLGMSTSATAIFLCCFCVTAIFLFFCLFNCISLSIHSPFILVSMSQLHSLTFGFLELHHGYLIINEKKECEESLGNSLSSSVCKNSQVKQPFFCHIMYFHPLIINQQSIWLQNQTPKKPLACSQRNRLHSSVMGMPRNDTRSMIAERLIELALT